MQKIVVFGGTGMTGQCAVAHAIKKGLNVRLMVRDEATLPEQFKENVDLVKGNVLDIADVQDAVKGVDGVCVVLGTRNSLAPTTDMSTGMKNIITAMKDNNVSKVSVCLSAFLFFEEDKVPKVFIDINADHQRMLDAIKDSGLEYVAILPPHIANEPSQKYEVCYDKTPGRTISKYDLGQFLIDSLDQNQHYGKIVGIANIKPQPA